MKRKSITFGNVSFPLDHLESFQIVIPAKNPLESAAKLQVTFSCHVFSEKWIDGIDETRKYIEGHQRRAFCPVRYGCSIKLPDLIKYHVLGKAYESKDGNGYKRNFFYADADSIQYPIYFELSKATNIPNVAGILHIISAYQKPNLPAKNRLQSVKFARLVHINCPPD